jgi:hypothetical protein
MKTYILNQDVLGYDINLSGGAPTILAFKKGDKVKSDKIVDNYMWMSYKPLTTPIKGIEATPTVSNPKLGNIAFIPLTSLTETSESSVSTNTTTSKTTDLNKVILYIGIALVGYWLIKKL